jgi:hypothetical protein
MNLEALQLVSAVCDLIHDRAAILCPALGEWSLRRDGARLPEGQDRDGTGAEAGGSNDGEGCGWTRGAWWVELVVEVAWTVTGGNRTQPKPARNPC